MKLYKVQDLGLPDRWSNFTVFSSEVSRLVLLSERGRTHGSIWGVPPFLEGILRATVATTMTTSYFYSYINTSSYQTTYTITIRARQSAYSVMGEWWESNDGKNWYKVDSAFGRRNGHWDYYGSFSWHWDCRFSYPPLGSICRSVGCVNSVCSQQDPPAVCFEPHFGWWQGCPSSYPQLLYSLTVNQIPVLLYLATPSSPRIFYYRANESLVVSVGITSYTVSGRTESCSDAWDHCVKTITEWGRKYQFQAIELVDWDTGEVYASLNQTSLTFNINANTIVRFKYVLVDSWSRSWEVILQPPSPTPNECQQILNDPNTRCTRNWCSCVAIYDPETYKNSPCCNPIDACLEVSVSPCCSGDETFACLNSWSGQGGSQCVTFTQQEASQGITKPITVSWSASWSLKPGWALADIGKAGPANCNANRSGNSASGSCTIDARAQARYWTQVIIIFKKTQ
jgi:hypothetical protein